MGYRHVFFDLDHTLWDADANSAEALRELYVKHELHKKGITDAQEFISKYIEVNQVFWDQYAKGTMSKQTLRYKRFLVVLQYFGVKDYDLSYRLSDEYVLLAPHKSIVQPYTHEVLEYLSKKYVLHILTNGFEDAQYDKLKASKIDQCFKHVITAERAGSKKPSPLIFEFALKLAQAKASESIVIGDNLEVDVLGAKQAGLDQVYFNLTGRKHSETITYEIRSLKELMEIL